MYRMSPLTYLAAAMMAAGIANAPVECSDIEVLSVTRPTGETCDEYPSAYQCYARGTIINPNSADKCRFYPLQNTNTYLDSMGAEYSQRWRNATLMLVYICGYFCPLLVLLGATMTDDGRKEKNEIRGSYPAQPFPINCFF